MVGMAAGVMVDVQTLDGSTCCYKRKKLSCELCEGSSVEHWSFMFLEKPLALVGTAKSLRMCSCSFWGSTGRGAQVTGWSSDGSVHPHFMLRSCSRRELGGESTIRLLPLPTLTRWP